MAVVGQCRGACCQRCCCRTCSKAADASTTASALFAANSTQTAFESFLSNQTEVELSISILSAQSFCEVAVLLLIVAAFVGAGVVCARVIRSLLIEVGVTSAPAAVGRELIRHVVVTTAVVFVAFVVRWPPSPANCKMAEDMSWGDECVYRVMLQRVHAHVAVDDHHARVPGDGCAGVVAAHTCCWWRCGA